MIYPCISLALIASFSRVDAVWRAFDHLIAPGVDGLLFVPVHLADGDLRQVVDGCPVLWEEAWATLDTPVEDPENIAADDLATRWPKLASMFPRGWRLDSIGLGNSAGEYKSIERLSHPSGVRYVQVKSKSKGSRQ